MSGFDELGLSEKGLEAVRRLGFEEPTPVQEQAIPLVLTGSDLIAAASTGTGKTAAFALPILDMLEEAERKPRAPRVLIVTPTRELAQQVAGICVRAGRATGHYVTTVYGGAPYSKQIKSLRGGTDVLIATPGRLRDLMDRGAVDLSRIEVLVLDEADRMLDMGFLPDVSYIVDAVPDDRQTMLFSATIDKSIMKNLSYLLEEPKVVQIAKKGEVAESVDHYIMPVKQSNKPELLKCMLDELGHDRVIVFVRTKVRAEEVAKMLAEADFDVECIHSDRTQAQRRSALGNFAKGRAGIIVATDVLARGIDVEAVDYVVNYDLPDMAEDYIHRIGRTGRAGKTGLAISFVSQNSVRLLTAIENLIRQEIPVKELETFELDMGVLKKKRAAGKAVRKTKHQMHSDARAERFKQGLRPRYKGSQKRQPPEEPQYNYTGYGDLREGNAKQSSDKNKRTKEGEVPEFAQAVTGKRGSKANGRKSPDRKTSKGKPASKQKGQSKGKGLRKQEDGRNPKRKSEKPGRKRNGKAEASRSDRKQTSPKDKQKPKRGKRKNSGFKKGVSGKVKNAKKRAKREERKKKGD